MNILVLQNSFIILMLAIKLQLVNSLAPGVMWQWFYDPRTHVTDLVHKRFLWNSSAYHITHLMISQHWFRQWLGAVRQKAFNWANIDRYLRRHRAFQCHNEITRGFSWSDTNRKSKELSPMFVTRNNHVTTVRWCIVGLARSYYCKCMRVDC